ncbi:MULTISPECIES: lipocalin family protein [unclassified Sphingobacterium]|uniref:lipocalin family protein n=1 Tax=unclassified Sphingobacterium TaxID=2609468 RepID=UPI0025E3F05B|nr:MULTISPECIES: lipocalin family protein [unclassified Sphingobacterium]
MKTNKSWTTVILLTIALICAAGCKKSSPADEESKAIQEIKQKVIGRWNLVDFIEETKKGDEPPKIIDNDPKNVYFEFFANDKGKTNAEGEEEFVYEIKANNILILWGYPTSIIELTGNKLTFRNTATADGTTYTQTYYLTR